MKRLKGGFDTRLDVESGREKEKQNTRRSLVELTLPSFSIQRENIFSTKAPFAPFSRFEI